VININNTVKWDAFISHATEDKQVVARPLAKQLQENGLRIWFDEFTLTVGDSLRQSIDKGLAESRFGIVVVIPPS
jgi:predicted nucleotide-binding protein